MRCVPAVNRLVLSVGRGLLLGAALAGAGACDDASAPTGTADALADVADAATRGDVAQDAAQDAIPDSAGDAGASDAAEDTGPDASVDAGPPTELVAVAGDPNFAVAAAGWYRGDLHYHTTYSGDAAKQGGDTLATCLAIADAFRDPDYLAYYPERAGNGLDYIAITDHRTMEAMADPDFTHPHLILVPGAEYGGSGHAGILGVETYVPHDPVAGESPNARHGDAIAEVHAQGGVFIPNHPTQDNAWFWDVEGYDAIEGWNGPWLPLMDPETLAILDEQVAAHGVENPFIRDAVASGGAHSNLTGLRFWYGHLTAGRHVAFTGGGDRHMLVPAGLPTTYVRIPQTPAFVGRVGQAVGSAAITQGIAEGGTVVARSPFAAQIDLVAIDGDGVRYPLGAALPGPGTYTIEVTVGRAADGLLRLVAGPLKAPEADGRVIAEPATVWEQPIPSDLARGTFTWQVGPEGGWLHAIALDPLVVGEVAPEIQDAIDALSQSGGDPLVRMISAFTPLVDTDLLFSPETCDPASWTDTSLQCMPVDKSPFPTFYFPDAVERVFNAWTGDGGEAEYALGAITSAFMAPAAP